MQTLTVQERERLIGYLPSDYRSNPMLNAWIDFALLTVGRSYYKDAFIYALSLVVAHKAALATRGVGGEAGAVTSIREGDISVSYASGNAGDDSFYNSTSYGQEYLMLKKQYSVRPGVTGGLRFGHCI